MIIRKGIIKIYRREALQIQLPPDTDMARFRIKVTEKKNAANIPSKMAFKAFPPV